MSGYQIQGIASGTPIVGTRTPFQLWAGEAPILTDSGVASVGISAFQPVAYATDGTLVPWVPTANDSTNNTIGVAQRDIAVGASGTFWKGGVMNEQNVVWPTGITTIAQKKKAFAGKTFSVEILR